MENTVPSPSLPLAVPRLESLGALYGVDTLPSQIMRYGKLKAEFFAHFLERSGLSEPAFFSAPGRTELCGNHTDHNHGKVLAAAISLDTIAAAAPRGDCLVRIFSEGFGPFEVDLADLSVRREERGSSAAIVRGVASGFAPRRPADLEPFGFDAVVQSDVLPGSGLSSSAAFEVLVGAIVSGFWKIEASPAEIAKVGQYAENRYFGKPSGLMDQMASALGSVVAIDFGLASGAQAQMRRFDPEAYGLCLVIVSTGGSHADLTDEYAAIPGEMKAVAGLFGRSVLDGISRADLLSRVAEIRSACGDRAFLRAWHFAAETERPIAMAEAIAKGDISAFLTVVRASGDSSWRFLQNVQSSKSAQVQGPAVALAITEEFLGGKGASRVHGGGFAGTIQAYVPTERFDAYRALMEGVFGPGSVVKLRIRPCGVVRIGKA